MKLLFTLAAFAVALGVLIVIHEFGHYIVARWCGVKVLRFSVGFGRPLFIKRWGRDRTEWVIAAFPLGGFVKMLDEREGPVDPRELPRAFNRQSVYRRFVIVLAGPLANFLLAIFLYWFLFLYGVQGLKPVLGPVPSGTPAAVANFQPGDTLVRINGELTPTWQDVRWALLQHALDHAQVDVEVLNDEGLSARRRLDLGSVDTHELEGDFVKALGLTPYQPLILPVIGQILADSPAERAGLQTGDEIIAVAGQPVSRWEEVVKTVRSHPGKPLDMELKRGDTSLHVTVTPDGAEDRGTRIGKIGVGPHIDRDALEKLMTVVRYSPGDAFMKALRKTRETSIVTLQMLGKMIVGDVSLRNVSGPITIANYAGQTAQMGLAPYLTFLALISISLGVLNLFPIPLLDGGHLMYYMVEIVRRRPLSERAMEIGQQVGIALLFTLMAFAIYNDINRLITG